MFRHLSLTTLPRSARYALATLAIVLIAVVRFELGLVGLPFLLFIPVLMGIGFLFGLGPGLYATVLSALIASFAFIEPAYSFQISVQNWVATGLYTVVNLGIVAVCAALKASLGKRDADIFALTQAEQRLARSEERLNLALGASGMVGIWDWDLKADLVYADANFARIYAVDRDWAARGAPLTEFVKNIHPDDKAAFQAELDRVLAGQEGFASEYRVVQADGSIRWVLARGRLVLDRAGAPLRFPGASVDITERKMAEAALQRMNHSLERRVEERTRDHDRTWRLAPVLMLVGDAQDGRILAVNPAWTDVMGWSADETVGRDILDFVTPENRGIEVAGLQQLLSGLPIVDHQNSFVTKAGERRQIAWTTVPDSGRLYGYGRDITDQLATEEKLRQSQKMEAVGQLTGGIAHDFNNLLTGISGSLDMLQKRTVQGRFADVDRYVTAAQGAAKRAAALTHRLLAFSRRQTLDPRPTDMNRLVVGMEDLIRRTVGPEIAIDVVRAEDLWTTLVDPNQLENALLNLCINARDAMPDGGRLRVETAKTHMDDGRARLLSLEPGEYVTLSVTDTGTGMTPDVLERAFDPFFTTKPLGMGTGLGLSMIYGFAQQSGGQARITSELGQGTTVCIVLPRHLGEDQTGDTVAPPAPVAFAQQGETVLIVDDEQSIRMLVTDILGDLGYTAIEAVDGASGVTILHSDARIDLLITDVGLPGGMNGRQVADAGREWRPNLKVLFITGYAENVIGNRQLDPGMEVITKPFAMDALAARIKDLLARP